MPDCLDAYLLKASALQQLGLDIEAIDVLGQAVEIHPQNIELHNKAAYLLTARCENSQIFEQFRALISSPVSSLSRAYMKLGHWMRNTRHKLHSINCFIFAVKMSPADSDCWYSLAVALRGMSFMRPDPELEALLNRGFSVDGFDYQMLFHPSIEVLKADGEIGGYLGGRLKEEVVLVDLVKSGRLGSVLTRELFINLLKNTVVMNPNVEILLTSIRRIFLGLYAADLWSDLDKNNYMLCAAIAHLSFNNEYVFYVTDDECEKIDIMMQSVNRILSSGGVVDGQDLLLLAAYMPLNCLENSVILLERCGLEDDQELESILTEQILEPHHERALKKRIKTLGAITSGTSSEVRAQYEKNPYPRWKTISHRKESAAFDKIMRGSYKHLNTSEYIFPDAPSILVAGCGTGRQAIQSALDYSNSTVLALDLSLSSLAYAIRKAEEMSVGNLCFAQADILGLGDLNERFDVIECTGVLHHMDDPRMGWRVLASLLKPGGYMKIALYSEIGRRFLVPARNYIKENGYQATNGGIRQFRHDVIQAGDRKELQPVMLAADFYSLSECRDMLFHTVEHRFTLQQINTILEDMELEFIGFELAVPSAMSGYKQRYPDDATARSLSNWHKYEIDNPFIFSGMYQFWVRAAS